MTEDQIIEKVRKLLDLAKCGGATAAEAESAMNAATRLLETHNMDMHIVQRGSAKRADNKRGGGLYNWQRQLWKAVAELNMCHYEARKDFDPEKDSLYAKKKFGAKIKGGWVYNHRIIGSKANVISTELMAAYLEEAIERITRAKYSYSIFCKDATIHREGMATSITYRLWDKRKEILREEKAKAEEAARQYGGGQALVLASAIDAEKDANDDYLYGEGYSARRRAARAEYDAKLAEAVARRAIWEAEHPEEAAREKATAEAKRKADNEAYWRKNANRKPRKKDEKYYSEAWEAGREAGESVGLDKQAQHHEVVKIA